MSPNDRTPQAEAIVRPHAFWRRDAGVAWWSGAAARRRL